MVLDSAFPRKQQAQQRLVELGHAGYSKTGFFWIPNFEYLSGKELFQVYLEPFKDKALTVRAVCDYNRRMEQVTDGVKLSAEPAREEIRCRTRPGS